MDHAERVARRIKLRDLQLLDAVSRLGSIAKAAGQLNLTQPAASKAIAQLEHAVGVRLLDRTARGVEPTRYGRVLLMRGLAMFDELRQGMKEIEFLSDPTAGEVKIGCPEATVAGLVPAVIEQLGRRYPRVVCDVTWMPPDLRLQLRALRERRVDLLLVRMRGSAADDDLHADILCHDPVRVAAGQRNRWLRRRKIDLADLMNEPWILPPPDSEPWSILTEAFGRKGLAPPHATVGSTSFHIVNRLLPTGRYLTIIPESALRFGPMHGRIQALPVDFPSSSRVIAIVTLKNRTLSPAASLFIDTARVVTQPLAKERRR